MNDETVQAIDRMFLTLWDGVDMNYQKKDWSCLQSILRIWMQYQGQDEEAQIRVLRLLSEDFTHLLTLTLDYGYDQSLSGVISTRDRPQPASWQEAKTLWVHALDAALHKCYYGSIGGTGCSGKLLDLMKENGF